MDSPRKRRADILLLTALSAVSLCLISSFDRWAFDAVRPISSGLSAVADARVPSFLLCFGLWVILRRKESDSRVLTFWVYVVAAGWLIGTLIADFLVRVYIPQVHSPSALAAFLVFGLMAEEFLFRGVIFELAESVFPGNALAPILVSSMLFSLQHLQYHHFLFTRDAFVQLAYTFPMGLAFGAIRWQTGRLWPAISVHFLNNALAVLRVFSMGS